MRKVATAERKKKSPIVLPSEWVTPLELGYDLSGAGIVKEYLKAPHAARNTEVDQWYFLWLMQLGAACFQMSVCLLLSAYR